MTNFTKQVQEQFGEPVVVHQQKDGGELCYFGDVEGNVLVADRMADGNLHWGRHQYFTRQQVRDMMLACESRLNKSA